MWNWAGLETGLVRDSGRERKWPKETEYINRLNWKRYNKIRVFRGKKQQQQQWHQTRKPQVKLESAETLNWSGVSENTPGPRCTTRGDSGPSRPSTAVLSPVTIQPQSLKLQLRRPPNSTRLMTSRSHSAISTNQNPPSSGSRSFV